MTRWGTRTPPPEVAPGSSTVPSAIAGRWCSCSAPDDMIAPRLANGASLMFSSRPRSRVACPRLRGHVTLLTKNFSRQGAEPQRESRVFKHRASMHLRCYPSICPQSARSLLVAAVDWPRKGQAILFAAAEYTEAYPTAPADTRRLLSTTPARISLRLGVSARDPDELPRRWRAKTRRRRESMPTSGRVTADRPC